MPLLAKKAQRRPAGLHWCDHRPTYEHAAGRLVAGAGPLGSDGILLLSCYLAGFNLVVLGSEILQQVHLFVSI